MQEELDNRSEERPEKGALQAGAVSRRQFLKLAGVAGAAVGMGAGVGGLLAACGEETAETTEAEAEAEESNDDSDDDHTDGEGGFGLLRRRGLGAAFRELADS